MIIKINIRNFLRLCNSGYHYNLIKTNNYYTAYLKNEEIRVWLFKFNNDLGFLYKHHRKLKNILYSCITGKHVKKKLFINIVFIKGNDLLYYSYRKFSHYKELC